jgi:phage shock protein A
MPTASTPEARALLVVFVVVLATAAIHTVANSFDRLETTDARARSATGAAQELKEKVDELESQLEELRDTFDERR